jgi:hypothetical protein
VNTVFAGLTVPSSTMTIENNTMNHLFINKMTLLQTEFGIVKNLPINARTTSEIANLVAEANVAEANVNSNQSDTFEQNINNDTNDMVIDSESNELLSSPNSTTELAANNSINN